MQVGMVSGKKLAYVISKNIGRIKEALRPGNEILKETDRFKEYEKKRTEICVEYCEKDGENQPKVENKNYVIATEKMAEFNGKVDALKVEYQDALDDMDSKRDEYQKFLDKESTYEPYVIKMKDIPESITPNQINGIMEIIDDSDYSINEA